MKPPVGEYVLLLLDGRVIDYDNICVEKEKETVQTIGGVTKNGFTNYRIEIVTDNEIYPKSPTVIMYTKNRHYRFENCQLDAKQTEFFSHGIKNRVSFWTAGPTEATQGWQE